MRAAFLGIVLVLSGCASEIMQGYVGKDITEVVVDYGPPAASFDMPDGRRAFQWQINSTYIAPATTTFTTNTVGGFTTGSAQTYGGGIFTSDCRYTLYAQPSGRSYTIVGFEPPRWDCE